VFSAISIQAFSLSWQLKRTRQTVHCIEIEALFDHCFVNLLCLCVVHWLTWIFLIERISFQIPDYHVTVQTILSPAVPETVTIREKVSQKCGRSWGANLWPLALQPSALVTRQPWIDETKFENRFTLTFKLTCSSLYYLGNFSVTQFRKKGDNFISEWIFSDANPWIVFSCLKNEYKLYNNGIQFDSLYWWRTRRLGRRLIVVLPCIDNVQLSNLERTWMILTINTQI